MVHHLCYLILSVIVNALWLVLCGLALPLNPTPGRVLLALRPKLAHPRPAVAEVVECLTHSRLIGLDHLEPADFELRRSGNRVQRRAERGSRSPVLCWRRLRFHIRIGGSDHPY